MSKKKIAILFKSSNTFGYGHMYRVHHLYKLLESDYDISLFSNLDSINYKYFQKQSIIVFQSDNDDAILEKIVYENYDCILIDRLNNKENFVIRLKSIISKVIVFDDCGPGAQYSDVLINALIDLPEKKPKSFYHGYSFIIYDDAFDDIKNDNTFIEKPREVFICFGGSDPNNISELIIPVILENTSFHFTLVLGPGYKEIQTFIARYNKIKNLSLLSNVKNMENLINYANICIVSGGLTLYECLYLKKNIIVACQVEHQMAAAKRFEEHLINLGIIHKENKEVLNNINKILTLRDEAFKEKSFIHLKNGKFRIKEIIDKEIGNDGVNHWQ